MLDDRATGRLGSTDHSLSYHQAGGPSRSHVRYAITLAAWEIAEIHVGAVPSSATIIVQLAWQSDQCSGLRRVSTVFQASSVPFGWVISPRPARRSSPTAIGACNGLLPKDSTTDFAPVSGATHNAPNR